MLYALQLLVAATALVNSPLLPENFELAKSICLTTFGCLALPFARRPRSRFDWLLVAFCASAFVSAIAGDSLHDGLFGNYHAPLGCIQLCSLLVVYLCAGQLTSYNLYSVARTALLCAAFASLWALLERFGVLHTSWEHPIWIGTSGVSRPPATFGHPNFLAAYLAMCVPFLLDSRTFKRSYVRLLLAALLLATLVVTESRGCWLACVASLSVWAICTRDMRKGAALLVCLLSLALTCFVLVLALPHAHYSERFYSLLVPSSARLEYWRGALRLWDAHMLFGCGTDNFKVAFAHVRSTAYWVVEPGGLPDRAHNDLLNVLATQGALGFGVLLAAIWTFTKRAFACHQLEAHPALYASLAAFALAGITGFAVTPTLVLAAILVGFPTTTARPATRDAFWLPFWACVSFALWFFVVLLPAQAYVLVTPGLANPLVPLSAEAKATTLVRALHFPMADPVFWSDLGVLASQSKQPALLALAAHEGIHLEPWRSDHWFHAAGALDIYGHYAEATNSLAQALYLEPTNAMYIDYAKQRALILKGSPAK